MGAFIKFFGGAVAVIGGIFFLIILGTLMGGFAGWVVGLVFVDTIASLKQFLGLAVTNFELGAMLGFVGGFFRSSQTNNNA